MDTLLLIAVIVLLVMEREEHRDCHETLMVLQDESSINRQVKSVELKLKALTDDALQTLLDEAKRWQPGTES